MHVRVGDLLVSRLWRWDAERLEKDARREYADQLAVGVANPEYSISVFALVKEPDVSVEDLMVRLCAGIDRRAKWVTFTTGDRLGDEGFRIQLNEPPDNHYDVILGTVLTPERLDDLAELLGEFPRRRFPTCQPE